MASFYTSILLLYTNIIAIPNVHGNNGDCIEHFNPTTCAYDVLCRRVFNMYGDWDYYRYGYGNVENTFGFDRNTCKFVEYNGYNNLYPIHLTFKEEPLMDSRYNADDSIPPTENSYLLNLITSVDFSNNDYENTPNLKQMNKLLVVKLSNNSLTVANLSNRNELPLLTEIYLSHNTISDIQYDESSQHVYRKLKKIDLSYNYLTKITDAVFDPFEELESLDISHNFIDALSPITFEGAKKLLFLNISYNRISDINSSLFRFNELKLLDLSNNKIKNIKTTDFEQLISLETLDLSSNFISIIERHSFDNMLLLNNFCLNNNKLEYVEKDIFNNVSSLVNIDMSENNFKALPRGLFKNKNIRNFLIKDNGLEGPLVKGIFLGLSSVTELDLSNQHLDSVDDYAFQGLEKVLLLLLNENKIRSLSSKCFRSIQTLTKLDLSSNKIENIEFEKEDLFNLISLSLRNNHLTAVKQENFHGLNSLQFLDLSDNIITQVEINSFKSLKDLINFEISNNPLSGTLEESTFDGLNSLPSLDISCTLLSTVKNGSFIGMIQLKNLNVSHSKINTLEYNIFAHTGSIESIDLSSNELKEFNINSTELVRLNTLYLNNNQIKTLYSSTFQKISKLEALHLSYNMIQNVDPYAFTSMKQLRLLDISYNTKLKFTEALLNRTKHVDVLNLSGIKTDISFSNIKDVSLSHLIISNSSLTNVKLLQLNELQHLDTLNLSYNDITKLETGGFYNISTLKNLDLSNNKITFIQPGVFRDNAMLLTLNVSHNFLTDISYGIFRGLIYLHTLDISYNNINDLQNERFYEVNSLSVLIADHNKIESISLEEFQGTSLTQLSIGDNPIPCGILVNFKRSGVPFLITASRLDYTDDNLDGVTCNKKSHTRDSIVSVEIPTKSDNKVLNDIREILLDHFNKYQPITSINNVNEQYLANLTEQIQKTNSERSNMTSNLLNVMTLDTTKNNETNILLNKILNVLRTNSATTLPPIQIAKDNVTYENLILYISRVKQELADTIKLDKTSILNEVDAKLLEVNANFNRMLRAPEMPQREKLTASADSKSSFTEICVVLILIILVGFVLLKIYTSRRKFVRQSFSISTRELPGAMDSAL